MDSFDPTTLTQETLGHPSGPCAMVIFGAGGDLTIEWRESDDHVLMTGPVKYEHAGRFDAAVSVGARAW